MLTFKSNNIKTYLELALIYQAFRPLIQLNQLPLMNYNILRGDLKIQMNYQNKIVAYTEIPCSRPYQTYFSFYEPLLQKKSFRLYLLHPRL